MPVSREEALWAYRMILGREPENDAVLGDQGDVDTVDGLREKFFNSAEFAQNRPYVAVGLHLNEKVDHVDVACSPEQLQRMLDRIAAAWKSFGEDEPYWSVLTDDRYKKGAVEERIEEFYNSGRGNIDTAVSMLQRNAIDLKRIERVIDFGCGVGRLSLALAGRFPEVVGVDVSEPHLAIARAEAGKRNIGNATFRAIQSIDALADLPQCDLLLTLIVLQHNPPPVIVATLERLLGRVAPGGCAIFQLPTYMAHYGFDAASYLANEQPQMEMNVLPQRHVFTIARKLGFDVLEVREDLMAAHPRVVSQTFLLKRPG